jgi:hypothetical protein
MKRVRSKRSKHLENLDVTVTEEGWDLGSAWLGSNLFPQVGFEHY